MMLHQTIRYISDGEPLDEETLNRHGSDVQNNLEDLFDRLSRLEGKNYGEVDEIPNTLVLRNSDGTASFSGPTEGTHPIRMMDSSIDANKDSIVKRNSDGTSKFSKPTENQHPYRKEDGSTSRQPDTLVLRDSNGDFYYTGNGLKGNGTKETPTSVKLANREGNLLQSDESGLYMGLQAPPDVENLYVSSSLGNDSNSGTRESPLKTINEAMRRVPVNSTSTIYLRAAETHDLSEGQFGVVQAVRKFEVYDDPYVDGANRPVIDDDTWYYEYATTNEIKRPKIVFKWGVNLTNNTTRVARFILSAGGSISFKGCHIIRDKEPDGFTLPVSAIVGPPSLHNGVVAATGCIFEDLSSSADSLFAVRSDTGTLNFALTSVQVRNGTRLLHIGGGTINLSVGTLGATPNNNPAVTQFEGNIQTDPSAFITGIVRVNNVPVNIVTNLSNI